MAKIIHSMIRVQDLQTSIDFYGRTLNLKEVGRFELPTFTLVYLGNSESEVELELTWNHDQTEPYTHGSGYGHLAVSVEDARALHAKLLAMGEAPADVKEFGPEGQVMARFFFLTDPDGYKIEVLERLGRFA